MPIADELTAVQTKITARINDVNALLALGQSTATTTLLNDIKTTLNALQSDHTDVLNETYSFPTKINAKLGFDAQLDQAKIEQNYQILDALDACENPVDFYTALACALFGGVDWLLENPTFTQALRNYLIAQIQAGVGSDFSDESLDIEALLHRFELLPIINDLDENYSVTLIATDETLGEWFSNPAADLSIIVAIFQAVEATAEILYSQIVSWDDPNSGYLRSASPTPPTNFTTTYINSLRSAGSASDAFTLVCENSNLLIGLEPSHYPADSLKLFGYLKGWEYARFARRLIQIDWDIYEATFQAGVASRLWNSQNWLPTSNALLRTDWSGITGFANRGVVSIDPVYSLATNSPYDLILEYRARTVECTAPQADKLCHDEDNCYKQSVIDETNAVNEWQWAGLPRLGNYLPFLPKSILTGCVPARRSLAKGIIALWNEIGIYQDYEEVTRLVNLLEHGDVLSIASARQALFQYLHHIYYTTQTIYASREVEYVAGMSSAIFDYDNAMQSDVRTYRFLINILTPIAELTHETNYANEYATEPLGNFTWDQYASDLSLYTTEIQLIISQGANRTFGSTEFNNIPDSDRRQVIEQQIANSSSWVAFFSSSPQASPDLVYDLSTPSIVPLAPFGVFLVTPQQFNDLQDLIPN